MEENEGLFESLIESGKRYGETRLELLKLKSVDNVSHICSTLIIRLFFILLTVFVILFLNVALALWIGDVLNQNYYGFLLVAAAYGFIGIIFYLFRSRLKNGITNSIIRFLTQLLCKK